MRWINKMAAYFAAIRCAAISSAAMLCVAMASASSAAAEPAPDQSGTARAAMAALRPLAGDWSVAVYSWRDEAWSEPETERATYFFLLNDLALRKAAPERPAGGARLETTIQYDQYRDVYRLVALDDTWGNLDVFEGRRNADGAFVLTNLRSGTVSVGPGGEEYAFRLTLTIESDDANTLAVDISVDGGETWRPFQRLERTRLL